MSNGIPVGWLFAMRWVDRRQHQHLYRKSYAEHISTDGQTTKKR